MRLNDCLREIAEDGDFGRGVGDILRDRRCVSAEEGSDRKDGRLRAETGVEGTDTEPMD
jgi:hypothetical protein